MKRFRLGHYVKTSLWVVPLLFVLAGAALSLITTSIDDGSLIPQSVSGDPTAALQILYLISFAMLTLTGLVLSLLVVAVQLAMGTFSPRIVRQILQDRPSQAAIGLFAGTFTHAMLSMRAVRTTPDGGTVPGLAVIVAIVLVLGCIGTLVWYLNHITQSLRPQRWSGGSPTTRSRHLIASIRITVPSRTSGRTSSPHRGAESSTRSATTVWSLWPNGRTAAWSFCGRSAISCRPESRSSASSANRRRSPAPMWSGPLSLGPNVR
ncbi:MAG: DUF2254 domain-containing protein [Nocardioidaceae bacterium]|nr:DUF2254 domain-containing protein [Nocardioidaceae bacterium]